MKCKQPLTKFMMRLVILAQVLASFSAAVAAMVQPAALTPLLGAPSTAQAATGATPPTATQINGLVWLDANADGVNDSTEIGLTGATVTLFNAANAQVAAVTTPASGLYSFTGLDPAAGPFRVRVSLPSPYVITIGGADNDMSRVSPAVGEATSVAAGTQADAAARPSWVVQLGRAGAPGYASGTAPFDTGCPGAGLDCSADDTVVRSQDSITFNWSVSASNTEPGTWPGDLTNLVFQQTFMPTAGANILAPSIPAVCNGTGQPSNRVTVNADRSITLICNLGTYTTGAAKIVTVVLPLVASQNNATITSLAEAYGSNTAVTGGNATTPVSTTYRAVPATPVTDTFTISAHFAYDINAFLVQDYLSQSSPVGTWPLTGPYYLDTDNNPATPAVRGQTIDVAIGIHSPYRANEPIQMPLTFGLDFFVTQGSITTPYSGAPLQVYPTNTNCMAPYAAASLGACTVARVNPLDATAGFTITVNNFLPSNTFPSSYLGSAVPSDVYYEGNYVVRLFLPDSEADQLDGIIGNNAAGSNVWLNARVTNFDPVSTAGQTNNDNSGNNELGYCDRAVNPYAQSSVLDACEDNLAFGDQNIRPLISRNFDNAIISSALPPLRFDAYWNFKNIFDVYPGTAWNNGSVAYQLFPDAPAPSLVHSGSATVNPDNIYRVRIQSGLGSEYSITGTVICDVFDNSTQQLVAASAAYTNTTSPGPAGVYAWVESATGYNNTAADWTFDYGSYDLAAVDPVIGPLNPSGRYPGNWSAMQTTTRACATTPPPDGWFSDPTQVPGGLAAVNAIRIRRTDPNTPHVTDGGFNGYDTTFFSFALQALSTYNGGPDNGDPILEGTVLADMVDWRAYQVGGTLWQKQTNYTPEPVGFTSIFNGGDTGDRVTLARSYLAVKLRTLTVDGVGTAPAAIDNDGSGTLGQPVIWEALPSLVSLTGQTETVQETTLTLDLPSGITYDAACTTATTGSTPPAQILANTPAAGQTRLVWTVPSLTSGEAPLSYIICTQSNALAPSSSSYNSTATLSSSGTVNPAQNGASDGHQVTLSSINVLDIAKAVDAGLDVRNDTQQYTLGVRNRSTGIVFNDVTLIEVFPYNGDATNSAGAFRTPGSSYTPGSTLTLTGVPTAVYPNASGAPAVPSTFLYTADAPATVDYIPVASADSSTGNTPGDAVTLTVTANDTGGDSIDSTTVQLVGADAGSNGITKTVPGEGTWSVNPTTGAITFTPEAGFIDDPTPIQYTVKDDEGNTANPATVTVDYVPVATDDASAGNTPGNPVTIAVTTNDTDGDRVDPSTVQLVGADTGSNGITQTVPGEGVWTVNPTTGEITFTPEAGFTGDPTPIQYTVKDDEGNTANPAIVTVDYLPVATDDASTANTPGVAVTLTVTANDTGGDSVDPTTVQLVGADAGSNGITKTVPGEGVWSVNPTTSAISFTPEAGFTGDPTPIQYTVEDDEGNISNAATVTVDYIPVATDDSSLGNMPGSVATLVVTANDTGGDSIDPTTVQLVGADAGSNGITKTVAGEGVWTVNPTTGAITFTPEAGFTGDPTPIQYTVEDDEGNISNPATVTVDYLTPPMAIDDKVTVSTPSIPVTVPVLANDIPGSGALVTGTLQISGTPNAGDPLVVAGEGLWAVNPTTGAITFTPEPGFTGDPVPIQYTVKDTNGLSATASVTVDYIPVASADSSTGNTSGVAVTLTVTTNDTGGDTVDPTTVQIVGADAGSNGITKTVPGEGTWTVNPTTGAITFIPEPGFTGDPTPIQYTVKDAEGNTAAPATVTVDYIPVASADSSTGNTPGNPVTLSVTVNDTTGDSVDPTTVQLVGADAGSNGSTKTVPGEGVWTVNSTTGAITFTPEAGFTGDPTPIQYTVEDGEGNTANPATVTVDYLTPPTAIDDEDLGNVPGTAVTLSALGNDIPGSGALVMSTLQISGTTNAGDPLVVAGEGTWSVNPTTGTITFTPEAGFTGDPSPIQYTVKDTNGLAATATVTIDYIPVATDDASTGHTPGDVVTLNVTTNDTGGDSVDPTTVQLVGADAGSNGSTKTVPGEGVWTVNPTTGAITFTPAAGFTGDPTPIQYTVEDDEGNTPAPATVTVDYIPVANDDSSTGNTPGNPVTLSVTANDTTGDTVDSTTVQLVGADAGSNGITKTVPGEGTWTANPTTGAITFTPAAGFTGDPTPIQYTVEDGEGNTANPATVTVDYLTPPTVTDDEDLGNVPGTAVMLSVLGNDIPGSGALVMSTLQISGTANAGNPLVVAGEGTWSVNPTTGEITFTPEAGFTGDPSPIQYTVKDANGLSATASVTVDYIPVASADSFIGNMPGSAVTLNVTTNDTGGDSVDPITVQLVGADAGSNGSTKTVPGEGVWTVNPTTGAITFTPEPGFTGDPTPIQYTVADDEGNPAAPVTVTITYLGLPMLSATKADQVLVDGHGDGMANPGDTLAYTITMTNRGNGVASNVVFTDTPDANTRLVVGSVQTSQGTVTQGNTPGDTVVGVNIGTLPAGGRATIRFAVTINNPLPAGVMQIANQGFVGGDNLPPTPTDDPDSPPPGDATITPVTVLASLGGYVWLDQNLNGLQEANEQGSPNIVVRVYSLDGHVLATTTTDAQGHYHFTDLPPGQYYVGFVLPPEYSVSPQHVGTDDTQDSDVDAITGRTQLTTLGPGQYISNLDAGLFQTPAALGEEPEPLRNTQLYFPFIHR